MFALYLSMATEGNDQIVLSPRPGDAIGAALRGVYDARLGLPSEMAALVNRLDRPR